ncbi:MAG: redox-regulated ATPase YchF [Solibacterales bacterium]|nr:redox-regulated ATPase YchF [Bryobacterales bacterium]|tara:strand:- start:6974 stop:8047 length:1074 start_codon:yes stop_codon:yes gene_type:complete
MKTAILGLPQVGKTSLFSILTGSVHRAHIGGTQAQVGIAKVPDTRLNALAEVFEPDKVTHAAIEYADMPPTSRESLAEPSYVGSLRSVDAFAHVLRAFENDTVMHTESSINPERDEENLDLELIINDLAVIEKRLERVKKDMGRIKNSELVFEQDILLKAKEFLESERPLREMELDDTEAKRLRGFQFLSEKPMLLVLNLGETQTTTLHATEQDYRRRRIKERRNMEVTAICGSVESEIAALEPSEAQEYIADYGFSEPGLDRLIQASYSLLGLMSFLTAGEKEVRAWTIPKNSTAVKAARAIHSDFEKKFIRAEAINWEKLVEHGSYAEARKHGELRLEGKTYIVEDGDVLVIRHG